MDGRDVPQVRSDGVKQIFVQDPDGYWIEINDAAKYR
jgi:lactoylglutathione lyase